MNNNYQRVGVFVDTANVYHSVRSLYGAHVNLAKLLQLLVGDRQLVRAIAYTISADLKKEKDFYTALTKSGYEIKSKNLQIFPGGNKKGNWDVGMTVDAIRMAGKLDVAIIISGDGDFVDLVEYLQHSGLFVEIASFGSSTSNLLREKSDLFIDLENHKDILIKTGRLKQNS